MRRARNMSTAPTLPRPASGQVRMQLPQKPSHHLDFSCVEERKGKRHDALSSSWEKARCGAQSNAIRLSLQSVLALDMTSGTTAERYRALCSSASSLSRRNVDPPEQLSGFALAAVSDRSAAGRAEMPLRAAGRHEAGLVSGRAAQGSKQATVSCVQTGS